MKKIMTGNYDNCKTGNLVSVSFDEGRKALFDGASRPDLATEIDFCKLANENINKMITEYYLQILSNIDPLELYESLDNETILLCYEDSLELCHRHLIAFYLELFLGIKTSEVKVNSKRQTYHTLNRPDYLKNELERIIKDNYDMHSFTDIKDAYEYNKSKVVPLKYNLNLKSLTKTG